MLEDIALLLELIFKEIPDYPNRIALTMRGLEGADTLGIFQILWMLFNLYILIRILQPSLKNEAEPNRLIYCAGALLIWISWTIVHFSPGHDSPFRYVREMQMPFLAIKLFTVYVNILVLLKVSILILRIFQMAFSMFKNDSVLHLIFKDSNLKLILTTKHLMRYLVIYMLMNALSQFLNPHENLVLGVLFVWGFALIPLLILCFLIAKHALHKRHQSIFIEIVADPEYMSSSKGLEETLSLVASKRMGTDLIVNEIFMGQIFRLAIAALLTYSVNHLLA